MISGECAIEVDGQSFELVRGDIVLCLLRYTVIPASSTVCQFIIYLKKTTTKS